MKGRTETEKEEAMGLNKINKDKQRVQREGKIKCVTVSIQQ